MTNRRRWAADDATGMTIVAEAPPVAPPLPRPEEFAFNPNQPRYPAGHPQGGQWRDTASAVGDLRIPDAGFTRSAHSLEPVTTGYAVALGGTDKLVVAADAFHRDGRPTARLRQLVKDRLDAAHSTEIPAGTKRALGAWHNPGDGKIEINVTAVFPASERERAFAFARSEDQIAMADLDAITRGDWDNAIIDTGGTGGNRDLEDELALQVFHLQGQHDQKSHGNRGGTPMLEAAFTPAADGPLSYSDENRKYMMLTYGTKAVADNMTDDERAAVLDLVSTLTLADEDALGRLASGTASAISEYIDRDRLNRFGDKMSVAEMPRDQVPLGLGLQLSALKYATMTAENGAEVLDEVRPAIDEFVDGNLDAAALSARITEASGIDQTTAVVRAFASSWNWDSTGIPGYAIQSAADRMRNLGDARTVMRSTVAGAQMKETVADTMAAVTDAIVSATYYTTQDALNRIAPGVSEFKLYRGLRSVDPGDYAEGDVVQPYPLSSWTSSPSYASVFTGDGREGPVIEVTIPREDIWSLGNATGFGDYDREMITFGEWNLIDSVNPGSEYEEWYGET